MRAREPRRGQLGPPVVDGRARGRRGRAEAFQLGERRCGVGLSSGGGGRGLGAEDLDGAAGDLQGLRRGEGVLERGGGCAAVFAVVVFFFDSADEAGEAERG